MIFTILLSIAIFQGIILGFTILKSPLFKSKANNYLAFALLTLSLLLLNLVLETLGAYETTAWLQFLDNIEWAFVFPVFVFLFVIHQVNHPIKNSRKIRWLFLPFIYSAVLNLFRGLDVVVHVIKIPASVLSAIEILKVLEFFMIFVFFPFMAIITYSFIKFSKDKQEKKWITFLWALVFSILFSLLTAILIAIFFEYDLSHLMKILALFSTVLIHFTAYYGIFKYRLASDKEEIAALLNKKIPSHFPVVAIYKNEFETTNSELFTKDNPYFIKLEVLCQEHQIYRDSSLNREKIAEKLGISAGYVSQLINTVTGDNFTNYINHFRVEAVKKMIVDADFEKYSLLAIGLESGFTSKTTFHNAFKKATGMTPNSYRNLHK